MTTEPAAVCDRRTLMRRTLGSLALTAAVATTAACGSSSSTVATQPDSPTPGPIHGAHVRLVSMTGGGGSRVSPQATLLDTKAHLEAFTARLGSDALKLQVRHATAVAKRSGYLVYAAVIALGCDRPPGADVALNEDGDVVISAQEVSSPLPECLAPVTTVAIASVPGAD